VENRRQYCRLCPGTQRSHLAWSFCELLAFISELEDQCKIHDGGRVTPPSHEYPDGYFRFTCDCTNYSELPYPLGIKIALPNDAPTVAFLCAEIGSINHHRISPAKWFLKWQSLGHPVLSVMVPTQSRSISVVILRRHLSQYSHPISFAFGPVEDCGLYNIFWTVFSGNSESIWQNSPWNRTRGLAWANSPGSMDSNSDFAHVTF
jgi:hypothetical protein